LEIPAPIPCPDNPKKSLKIQAEIVRILDAFTELTTAMLSTLAYSPCEPYGKRVKWRSLSH